MHRLAAGTGLASAAQTRTQTDDEATLEPAKVMEPTEEDDADDVDHEVDESSKKTCDSLEELGGAGRQLRWPDDEDANETHLAANQQLVLCVDYELVF